MMKILEYWKSAATTVVVLAGMVWGAVTWADEIVRNAKSVPELKQITSDNADQIKLMIEREKQREALTAAQGEEMLRLLREIRAER